MPLLAPHGCQKKTFFQLQNIVISLLFRMAVHFLSGAQLAPNSTRFNIQLGTERLQ
jgi:hypothetical protein